MKIDILAVGIHPDDVELSCSGTLARHIAMGKKAGILDLSRGELGTRGSAELRLQEAAKAAEILGVVFRENLGLADGFFSIDREHFMPIIQVIRKYRPDIILCNAINDRHPDHGRAAKLVAEASFLAGLKKIETEQDGQKQEAWRPKALYHYIQDYYINPDFVVDISAYMQTKKDSIMAFSSQFYDPKSNEPETPISSKDFMDFVEARSLQFGRMMGVRYGEGFTVQRAPGVDDLTLLR